MVFSVLAVVHVSHSTKEEDAEKSTFHGLLAPRLFRTLVASLFRTLVAPVFRTLVAPLLRTLVACQQVQNKTLGQKVRGLMCI